MHSRNKSLIEEIESISKITNSWMAKRKSEDLMDFYSLLSTGIFRSRTKSKSKGIANPSDADLVSVSVYIVLSFQNSDLAQFL